MADIFIVGDSMTRGYFGVPYVPLMATPCSHRGYDGATLSEIAVSAGRIYRGKSGTLVLAGGGNDLLSTYLRQAGHPGAEELTKVLPTDIEEWEEMTKRSIEPLSSQFSLVFTTLPIIGRKTLPLFNEMVDRFDEALRRIAEYFNAPVIDLGRAMRRVQAEIESEYFPPSASSLYEDAEIIHSDENGDLLLTRSRNLILTVDGIHLNRHGAAILAAEFDSFFSETLPVADTF